MTPKPRHPLSSRDFSYKYKGIESNTSVELVNAGENLDDASIQSLLDLDNVDRLLLKYTITYPDLKSSKLAKLLNVGEQYIRNRRKRPAFQLAVRKLQGTTDDLMAEAAKKAAHRLIDLIDHPNPLIALGAIKIALQKYISQISDATMDRILIYRTTIAPDGNLLQAIVKGEISENVIDV